MEVGILSTASDTLFYIGIMTSLDQLNMSRDRSTIDLSELNTLDSLSNKCISTYLSSLNTPIYFKLLWLYLKIIIIQTCGLFIKNTTTTKTKTHKLETFEKTLLNFDVFKLLQFERT